MIDRERASSTRTRFRVVQHAHRAVLRAKVFQERRVRCLELATFLGHVTKIEKRRVLLKRLAVLA
jgi:hypothetical protein